MAWIINPTIAMLKIPDDRWANISSNEDRGVILAEGISLSESDERKLAVLLILPEDNYIWVPGIGSRSRWRNVFFLEE